jgi:threonine/homoserine/homoserine lactone efflux protein
LDRRFLYLRRGLLSSYLNVQLISLYVAKFPCKSSEDSSTPGKPQKFIWGSTCFITAGMFFMKEETSGIVQLATLCSAALFCIVGLYWLEEDDILCELWKRLRNFWKNLKCK